MRSIAERIAWAVKCKKEKVANSSDGLRPKTDALHPRSDDLQPGSDVWPLE